MMGGNPVARRAREIFLEALEESDPVRRLQWVAEACGADGSLRAAVESLLSNHVEDGFLEAPLLDVGTVRRRVEAGLGAVKYREGMQVGRYRLLALIGEGGCGVVYRAVPEAPVQREVALKLLKPGMDSEAILARFELERQALALMDHPSIARVLDAGATEAGHPFFVMELVEGKRLTEHCESERLGVRERVGLMEQVCRAVEHAHQRGIIHRDLKPSNILVTWVAGKAVPKVIDFGVAKVIAGGIPKVEMTTVAGGVLGTPAYMSPEQLGYGGADVDTRADIYSLGVLLHELLCGELPFGAGDGRDALRRPALEEAMRVAEPMTVRVARMSVGALGRVAAGRRTDPSGLLGALRGDLDCIVGKALDPERNRRYGTAGAMAEDLRRHLELEPILARPAGVWDTVRRLSRRHRVVFASALVGLSAAGVGLLLFFLQYIETGKALERAEAAEREERKLRVRLEEANADEVRLRRLAESRRLQSRQQAYAADLNLVQQALAVNNLGRARGLLDRQRPVAGDEDLRGWEWRYLWQYCRSDALYTLCHRADEVASLVVSPDGRWLFAGEGRGEASLWEVGTRALVSEFPAGMGIPRAAFRGDSEVVAVSGRGSGDSWRPKIWMIGLPEGRVLGEFAVDGLVLAMRFSADGGRLVVVDDQGLITERDATTGEVRAERALPWSPGMRGLAALSETLDRVVMAGAGGKVGVFRVPDGGEVFSRELEAREFRSLAVSAGGDRIAVGGWVTQPDIWVLDGADGRVRHRLQGHNGWIGGLAFWPDGRRLVSASADQTLRVWDVEEGKVLRVLRGHRLEVWSVALVREGERLFSGSKDGSIYAWDPEVQAEEGWPRRLPVQARNWSFGGGGTNGTELLVFGEGGKARRWQLRETGGPVEVGEVEAGPAEFGRAARPQGEVAQLLRRLGIRLGPVEPWAVAPDGQRVVVARRAGTAQLLRMDPAGVEAELKGFLLGVHGVGFSPDGRRVLLGSNGAEAVKVFDVESHQELLTLEAPTAFVWKVGLSPDQQWLVASSGAGEVFAWRAPTLAEIAEREMASR